MTSPGRTSQPVTVPTLTVLPPSSDTESWSRSPSPHLSRRTRHHSRSRTKKKNKEEQGCSPIKRQWSRSPKARSAGGSVDDALSQMDKEEEQSADRLRPPSPACSGSRSPSPSRRSRWSLKSLLGRESEWDSCR